MTRLFNAFLLLLLGLAPIAFSTPPPETIPPRTPHDESIERTPRRFRLFGGPTPEGPEAQWERLQGYLQDNRLRRTIRHAGYLIEAWPDHPRAPEAQRLIADLEFARERYERSFQAYQQLIDNYTGHFDYDEVLEQQLECAEQVEKQENWALFGGFTNPMDAVPLYRRIITNAPHLDITPELILRIGDILMEKRQFAEAIEEFDLLEQRYPRNPLAPVAAWRRARAYEHLAERHPTDISPLESAWNAYRYLLDAYPQHEKTDTAADKERELYNRLAKRHFDQARFYQENMRDPQAALAVYRALLKQYPDSDWTPRAQARINALTESSP